MKETNWSCHSSLNLSFFRYINYWNKTLTSSFSNVDSKPVLEMFDLVLSLALSMWLFIWKCLISIAFTFMSSVTSLQTYNCHPLRAIKFDMDRFPTQQKGLFFPRHQRTGWTSVAAIQVRLWNLARESGARMQVPLIIHCQIGIPYMYHKVTAIFLG